MNIKAHIQAINIHLEILNEKFKALKTENDIAQIELKIVEIEKILKEIFIALKEIALSKKGIDKTHIIANCADVDQLKKLETLFTGTVYDPNKEGFDSLKCFGCSLRKFAVEIDRLKKVIAEEEPVQDSGMGASGIGIASGLALGTFVTAGASVPLMLVGGAIGAMTGGTFAKRWVTNRNDEAQLEYEQRLEHNKNQCNENMKFSLAEMEVIKVDFDNFEGKMPPPNLALLKAIREHVFKKDIPDSAPKAKEDPDITADSLKPLDDFEKNLHELASDLKEPIVHEFKGDKDSERQCILKDKLGKETAATVTHTIGTSKAAIKFANDATDVDKIKRGELFVAALINSSKDRITLTFKGASPQEVELAKTMVNFLETAKREYTLKPPELQVELTRLSISQEFHRSMKI